MAFYRDVKPNKMSRKDHMEKDWKAGEEGGRYRAPRGEKSDAPRGSYGKPARPYGEKSDAPRGNYGKPARPYGERSDAPRGNYGKPARPYGERFDAPRGSYGKPARPYGERSDAPRGSYGKPARPYGERSDAPRGNYGKPAPRSGDFKPARPAYGRPAPTARPAPKAAPIPRPADDYAPQFETPYTREPENLLSGRNPIREAIKAGRDIEKLLVAKGELSGSAREIVAMARENRIPVQVVERSRLDEITPHHQGMLAYASAYQYADVESMLALAKERGEAPFIVVLDGVTDPHNLGAIIRTAACVGAHGVIVPERRSVGLTPAAVKASAGAVETVKVARVTNLTRTIEDLKKQGLWVFAADMEGEDYREVKMDGPFCLVIGGEGEGISRLVLSQADHKVKLPMYGGVQSLNASVAAGILMYAAMSCRK